MRIRRAGAVRRRLRHRLTERKGLSIDSPNRHLRLVEQLEARTLPGSLLPIPLPWSNVSGLFADEERVALSATASTKTTKAISSSADAKSSALLKPEPTPELSAKSPRSRGAGPTVAPSKLDFSFDAGANSSATNRASLDSSLGSALSSSFFDDAAADNSSAVRKLTNPPESGGVAGGGGGGGSGSGSADSSGGGGGGGSGGASDPSSASTDYSASFFAGAQAASASSQSANVSEPVVAKAPPAAPNTGPSVVPTGTTNTTSTQPEANSTGAPLAANEVPLSFDSALTGWTVAQTGGSESGKGTVSSQNGHATMTEGDSFLVTLAHKFAVQSGETSLSFNYQLSFDTSDPAFINDAFEVALLDADGNPLVPTIIASRDSYLNETEGLAPALGTDATIDVQTVTLDLSGVPVDTEAKLVFRLVNNDDDVNTTVDIFSPLSDAPPAVTVGLVSDTAPLGPGSEPYQTDLLTNDPRIQGTVADDIGVSLLEASVDGGPFQDITSSLVGNQYLYDPSPLPQGPHHFVVRATDTIGQTADGVLDFVLNHPPVADAGGNRTVMEETTVAFDAAGSSDTEGLFSYLWTFEDGSTAEGSSATHVFQNNGVFFVSLTVTDTAGSQATDSVQVTVENATKFFVVDQSAHSTFRYGDEGAMIDSSGLGARNSRPRGIASNAAGDTYWVIDASKNVYVYDAAGVPKGGWSAGGLNQPQDITTDGTDIWIVDDAKDRVFRYAGAATRTSGSQNPSGSFPLNAANRDPSGVVTDGTTLWVTDEHAHANKVFVYSIGGSLLGSWLLDAANDAPSGITLNPGGGSDLWVVDRHDSVVYHYADATMRRSGSQAASDTFALAPNNHHAEGIADPPVQTPNGDSLLDADGRATFTTSEDFLAGTLFNTNATDVPDELRLNQASETDFQPFIWIANSGEGTVSKFDTRSGAELGRYQTGPTRNDLDASLREGWRNPSRTTVTPEGDVWVANRANRTPNQFSQPSIVKVLNQGFIDRNGNGVVDTAQDLNGDGDFADLGEVLPWDVNGDGQPDDERIAHYVPVGRSPTNIETLRTDLVPTPFEQNQAGIARSMAIDLQGRIWVGLYAYFQYEVYDTDGTPLAVVPTQGRPYGAVIDGDGQLWGATLGNLIEHIDTTAPLSNALRSAIDVGRTTYGITLDPDGVVWVSNYDAGSVLRWNPAVGGAPTVYPVVGGNPNLRGIAVDPDRNVWVASTARDSLFKLSFEADHRTLKPQPEGIREILVGDGPTAAVIDSEGYVWTTTLNDDRAWKIDPQTNTVVAFYATGDSPYNYSDMTGRLLPVRSGRWSEVIDAERDEAVWAGVDFEVATPPNTSVKVQVRASDNRGALAGLPWLDSQAAEQLANVRGRYLEVQVVLASTDASANPSLKSLEAVAVQPPVVTLLSPHDNERLGPGQILVTGRVEIAQQALGALPIHNGLAYVLVNGQPVDVIDASGNFFTKVDVLPGRNVYEFNATDAFGQTATTALTITGTQKRPGQIDFSQFADITGSFSGVYGRTSFNAGGDTLYVDLATRNDGTFEASVPLLVGIKNLDPSVRVVGADGVTPDGIPYYDFTDLVPGGLLQRGGQSDFSPRLAFLDRDREQFDYELVFYGKLNQAPIITSVPGVEAIIGKPYSYQVTAADPDGDPLTFELVAGPPGMLPPDADHRITWTPAAAVIGNHDVTIRVDDGRGGTAEQHYVLSTIVAPPNRPPVFTTLPVVEAEIGNPVSQNVYDADHDEPRQWAAAEGGNGHWYKIVSVPQGITWPDANDAAIALDGHLATITSAQENAFVFQLAALRKEVWSYDGSNTAGPWLGGSQADGAVEPDGGWSWVTGERFDFANWFGGSPDNAQGLWNENAIHFWVTGANEIGDTWNDIAKDGRGFSGGIKGYVVEFDQTPPGLPTYRYSAHAVDPDNDTVGYALLDGPKGMTVDPTTGEVRWTPTAADLNPPSQALVDPTLPVVPGYDVSVYTNVPDPVELAVDQIGNLFVGRDNAGSGGTDDEAVKIHLVTGRIKQISEYGDIALPDPDSVLFDAMGTISGVPGSVLVGGQLVGSTSGKISAILPDGSVRTIVGPSTTLGNVSYMMFDSFGRLLFRNANTNNLLVHDASGTRLLLTSPVVFTGLATDEQGRIFLAGSDGVVRVYASDGTLINNSFATGLGPLTRLAFGRGGSWGSLLYALRTDTGVLHSINALGQATVIATGFNPRYFAFGPDGALYVSEFQNDRILRIAPTRQTLGLGKGEHRVFLAASDGRGGVATQEFTICVLPEPANHSPVIISDPVTSAVDNRQVLAPSASGRVDLFVPDTAINDTFLGPRSNDPAHRVLVQFDVSSVGAAISRQFAATVLLKADSVDAVPLSRVLTVSVHQNLAPVDISRVTWNSQPTLSPAIDTVSLTLGDWLATGGVFDVTDLVRGWVDGSIPAFGLTFIADEATQPNQIETKALTSTSYELVLRDTYEYDVDALDPDNDTLTYSLTTKPDGMTIDSTTGRIQWPVPPDIVDDNTTVFSDAMFSSDDWTVETVVSNALGSATFSALATGGNPDAHRRVRLDLGSATAPALVPGISQYVWRNDAVYDPLFEGAIDWIDYSEDFLAIVANDNVLTGIAIRQAGNVYHALLSPGSTATWSTKSLSQLSQSDFRRGSSEPDFSSNGAPIQFGFVRSLGSAAGATFGISAEAGIDNWSVRITRATIADVRVAVEDGRGGFDEQSFPIRISQGGGVAGAVFSDMNGNRAWDRPPELLLGQIALGSRRYDTQDGRLVDIAGNGVHGFVQGPDGNIYATTWVGNSVVRYDGATGAFLGTFIAGGALSLPWGIAFGSDGNLYIANEGTDSVLKYDFETGDFLGTFASGTGLNNPRGIAFGPDGNLYVVGVSDSRLLKFDGTTGAFMSVAASLSGGPQNIVFGPDGDIYITEFSADRIAKYSGATGQFLGYFVSQGAGGLDGPVGLAFGPDGDLYVTGPLHPKVWQFNGQNGQFVRTVVTEESTTIPYGVGFTLGTLDTVESGLVGRTVYVDDNRNGRRDSNESSTLTDALGYFTLQGLRPGDHRITLEPIAGHDFATPSQQEIVVQDGTTAYQVNFGSIQSGANQENESPQFTTAPSDPPTAAVGSLFRYDAWAFDPDGDPLTFDLPSKPDGMAVDPLTGIVVWTPNAAQGGVFPVVLRVQDGQDGITLQPFEITVSPPNTPPFVTSTPPGPATVGLPYEYWIRAQDAEGDPLLFELQAPIPAEMHINADTGLLTWVPQSDQAPSQQVKVLVSADPGPSTLYEFTIGVVAISQNRSPIIDTAPRSKARAGQTYAYLLEARDPDGDPLIYTLDIAPAGMTIGKELDGSTSLFPGLVLWTPDDSQIGQQIPVRILVSDGRGPAAVQQFTIQVLATNVNSPPTIISTPPGLATAVGNDYVYRLKAEDPDGDPLLWTLVNGPAGMSLDQVSGVLHWSPEHDQLGPSEVVVQVQDTFLTSDQQSFTLMVICANLPPAIISKPPTQAVKDTPYVYAVRAVDPENDPITLSLGAHPEGMTPPVNGILRWTPTAAQANQSFLVEIIATDGAGGIASQIYNVFVAATPPNRPPVITSSPRTVASAGGTYEYRPTARDPEGDSVSFSLQNPLPLMTMSPEGLVQWPVPDGLLGKQPSVTVVATDSAGNKALQTFAITVRQNQPPVIQEILNQQVTGLTTFRYDVHVDDDDSVTYQFDEAPPGMTIDQFGRIEWAAPGTVGSHNVVVRATDSHGQFDTEDFQLAVIEDDIYPSVSLRIGSGGFVYLGPEVFFDKGTTVFFLVNATDNVGVATKTLELIDNLGQHTLLPLDANGRAEMFFDHTAVYDVIATAIDRSGNPATDQRSLLISDPLDSNGPEVTFVQVGDTPATNGQTGIPVTYLADVIGTVQADDLFKWTVLSARVDQVDLVNVDFSDPDYREIGSGATQVVNQTLGTFDPTLGFNDEYVIWVVAYDASGNGTAERVHVNVDGNAKLGQFRLEFTDLQIPLAGIPITISRVYDTRQAADKGDFSFGWSLGLRDARIRETVPAGEGDGFFTTGGTFRVGTKVYLTNPAGERVGFTFDVTPPIGGIFGVGAVSYPIFKPDPGVYDKLEVDPAERLGLEKQPDGTVLVGLFKFPYNPDNFVLTTKDGLKYRYNQFTGLQSITDPNGNTLTFKNDGIYVGSARQVTFVRDGAGRITKITYPALDNEGQPETRELTYTYDAAGDLRTFVQPVNDQQSLTTSFSYRTDQPHYLDTVTDPLGRTVIRTDYFDDGRIKSVTDANGNAVEYNYDLENNTETVHDANGNVTKLTYDDRGNVLEERKGEHEITLPGGATKIVYDSIVRNEYNSALEHPANRDRESRVIQVFLDDQGNTVKEVATDYRYDAAGNTTKVIDTVDGEILTREFAYNSFNDVTKVKDELGRQTVINYDAKGNLKEVINAIGGKGTIEYDTQGRPTNYTDFRSFTTSFVYQGNESQPRVIINPDDVPGSPATESRRKFDYNAFGQVTKTIDEEGIVTENRYDDTGRLVYERVGDDAPVIHQYEGHLETRRIVKLSEADPMKYTAADDVITEYGYWPNNLLRFEIDAHTIGDEDQAAVTGYEYDANGNRTFLGRWDTKADYDADVPPTVATTNPRTSRYEHATFEHVFVYDRLNRLDYELDDVQLDLAEKVPGYVPIPLDYEYDSAGNRTKTVDRNGRVRKFEYDERNRLIGEQWFADTGDTSPDRSFVWTYCTCGSIEEATGYAGPRGTSEILSHYVYTHDTLNRVKTVDNVGTKDMPRVVLTYDYDANGNRVLVSDNLGVSVESTYDSRNRLDTRAWVNQPGATPDQLIDEVMADFDYFRNGTEKELNRFDLDDLTGAPSIVGRTVYGDMDLAGRVKSISHRDAADAVLAEYDYQFDRLGLVSGISYDNQDNQHDFVVNYLYDDLGQLTDADYTDATTAKGIYVDEFYRYDKNGNRTDSYLHPKAAQPDGTSYVTSTGNRLLSDGTFDYQYDNDGNLVRKTELVDGEPTGKVTTFEYDHRNRLTAVTTFSKAPEGGGIILSESTYRYDIDGRRIAFATDDDGAGPNVLQQTRVAHNGDDTWADFDASNTLIARYLYGEKIDELLARFQAITAPSPGAAWYLTDRLGSIQALINVAGSVVNHIYHSSFGTVISQVNAAASDRFLFNGRELDLFAHHYNYRARYYDPDIGRFFTEDPMRLASQEFNLYRYVGNSPINATDPRGENVVIQAAILVGTAITLYQFYKVLTDPDVDCAELLSPLLPDRFNPAINNIVHIQCLIRQWLGSASDALDGRAPDDETSP